MPAVIEGPFRFIAKLSGPGYVRGLPKLGYTFAKFCVAGGGARPSGAGSETWEYFLNTPNPPSVYTPAGPFTFQHTAALEGFHSLAGSAGPPELYSFEVATQAAFGSTNIVTEYDLSVNGKPARALSIVPNYAGTGNKITLDGSACVPGDTITWAAWCIAAAFPGYRSIGVTTENNYDSTETAARAALANHIANLPATITDPYHGQPLAYPAKPPVEIGGPNSNFSTYLVVDYIHQKPAPVVLESLVFIVATVSVEVIGSAYLWTGSISTFLETRSLEGLVVPRVQEFGAGGPVRRLSNFKVDMPSSPVSLVAPTRIEVVPTATTQEVRVVFSDGTSASVGTLDFAALGADATVLADVRSACSTELTSIEFPPATKTSKTGPFPGGEYYVLTAVRPGKLHGTYIPVSLR